MHLSAFIRFVNMNLVYLILFNICYLYKFVKTYSFVGQICMYLSIKVYFHLTLKVISVSLVIACEMCVEGCGTCELRLNGVQNAYKIHLDKLY